MNMKAMLSIYVWSFSGQRFLSLYFSWYCQWGPATGAAQEGVGSCWHLSQCQPPHFWGAGKGGRINCAASGNVMDWRCIPRHSRMQGTWWSCCGAFCQPAILWCAVGASVWLVHYCDFELVGHLPEEWDSCVGAPQSWSSRWKDIWETSQILFFLLWYFLDGMTLPIVHTLGM